MTGFYKRTIFGVGARKQVATTPKEFIEYLKLYGVEITKSGKDYSYLHPHKQKPIRGKRLGENYTKREVLNVKSEIGRTVADAKAHALEQVDETLSEIKEQLKSTAKEIEREREDMRMESGFRKFMFWATPVLLFVQSVLLAILLCNPN